MADKDYGHRPYMDSDDYTSAMKRPADKAYDNQVKRPHSDDKKPYFPDDYPEMEYFYTPYDPPIFPPIPPVVPDDPRYPPIVPDRENPPDKPDDHEFYGCVFGVPVGPKFIAPGETTFSGIGTELNDPLVRLKVEFGPIAILSKVKDVNACMNGPYPNCTVIVQALEDIDPEQYQADGDYYPSQIVATTKSGQKCWFACWVVKCPPEVEFAWDYDSSAETIIADDDALIVVSGGIAPFEWAVVGEGYTLKQPKTTSRSNLLVAGPNSCGSAKITVVDACGTQIQASIRNVTHGHWEFYEDTCGMPLSDGWFGTCIGGTLTYIYNLVSDYTVGGQRQFQDGTWVVNASVPTGGPWETSGECEAHRFSDCTATWESPCVPMPDPATFTGGTNCNYKGNYDRCGESSRWTKPCFQHGYTHKWFYISAYLRTDPKWTTLRYWEWECP